MTEQELRIGKFERRVRAEVAAALREYCSAMDDVTEEARGGRPASAEQTERALEAKLRLENAEALLDFWVRRRDDSGPELPKPRLIH